MGIGGFASARGGLFLNLSAGRLRPMFGNDVIVFAIAGSACLLALFAI